MRMNKGIFTSFLLAFFMFMIINLPSLKIIYSSSLLNFIALGGLWGTGLYRTYIIDRDNIYINSYKLNYIMLLLFIWIPLFWVTLIQAPSTFSISSTLKFVSVLLFSLGIVLFAKKSELKSVYWLQLIWGVFLALSEVTIGIPKDRSLGQNYLITGVPIALTIVMLFGYVYSKNPVKYKKIMTLPIILILYGGLFSLDGRAPILFSVIVPVFIVFLGLIYEKATFLKQLKLILYPLAVLIVFYIILINIPEETIDRFLRMFLSITDEPRFEVYLDSLGIIINNPEGIGLLGYTDLGFGYPHNIILEIIMSGGYLMIIPLVAFVLSIIRSSMYCIQYKKDSVIWLAMILYLVLTWNVSFELSGSYMLFSSISLYVISTENIVYERKQMEKPVISANAWMNYDIDSFKEEQMNS